ncbi:MAG: tetratricopeptide repeat protein [Veillonella sp.]
MANYYNMAMVYKLQGQLNDSKQWFEKVLEKDPSNTSLCMVLLPFMQTKGMILRPLIG